MGEEVCCDCDGRDSVDCGGWVGGGLCALDEEESRWVIRFVIGMSGR